MYISICHIYIYIPEINYNSKKTHIYRKLEVSKCLGEQVSREGRVGRYDVQL